MSRRLTRGDVGAPAEAVPEAAAEAAARAAGRARWLVGAVAIAAVLGGAAAPAWAQEGQPDEAGEDLIVPDEAAPDDKAAGSDPFGESAAPAEGAAVRSEAAGAAPAEGEGRWTDQGLGASLGFAFGGRVTPGGVRVTGSYLYRLSQDDWFDGAAAFTIGSGGAECFRDRVGDRVCDHGATDGFAVDFVAAVRRSWPGQKSFSPFVRLGAALRFARFSGDQIAGLAVPLIGGGGVTIALSSSSRLVAGAQLEIGGGLFSRGLGTAPQLGLSMGLGIELAMR